MRVYLTVAILLAGFAAGWQVRTWKCEAALKSALEAQKTNVEKAHEVDSHISGLTNDILMRRLQRWQRD